MKISTRKAAVIMLCLANLSFGQSPIVTNTLSPVRQPTIENQSRSLIISRPMILSGNAEQMARQFLTANSEKLQLQSNLKDLVLERIQTSPGGQKVRFYQTKEGLKVESSSLVVSINNQNKVSFYMSDYHPGVNINSVDPNFSAEQSIAIAKNALAVKDIYGDPQAELVILPLTNVFKLAFKVLFLSKTPMGDWVVYVDALSGDVIWYYDNADYINGNGMVFQPDPLSSAEHYYGSDGFANNSGMDTPALTNERVSVVLNDILYSSGNYTLTGPYVAIQNLYSPDIIPAISNDGNFNYTRSQDGFEDVMGYYYIDQSQRYLQSIGFTNLENRSIPVDTHSYGSFFSPSQRNIALGVYYGPDNAEDAEVILHEYGHAIQRSQVGYSGFEHEMKSMGEGFGDYWAGAYAATVSNWESDYVLKWYGGLESSGSSGIFQHVRPLNSNKHYPEDLDPQQSIYRDGEIWSATLWDIHNTLGRTITDKLILESHEDLLPTAIMDEGAEAIIAADQNPDIFNGAHLFTLIQILYSRGYDVGVHGEQAGNQTWSGIVPINGDVFIPEGTTLIIEPGTEMIFRPNYDFMATGAYSSKAEIIVDGTLIFNGSENSEIILHSENPNGGTSDWGGITVESTGSLQGNYFNLGNADLGIMDNRSSNITIEHSSIHDCNFGIKLNLWEGDLVNITENEIYANNNNGITGMLNGYGEPENQYGTANISRNVIHGNGDYGIFISQAQTLIENNTVLNNGNGVFVKHVNNTNDYTMIKNNIIVSNNLNGSGNGLTLGTTEYNSYEIAYNDVWGNSNHNYVNISDRTGYFGNISVDPLLNSVFELTWVNEPSNDATKSPCIDAGDPTQNDPDNTNRDIGAIYYDKRPEIPTLSITTQDWEHPYLTWNSSDLDINHYTIYKKYYINKFNQTVSYVNNHIPTNYTDMNFVSLESGGATAYYKVSATDNVDQTSNWSNTESTDGIIGMARPVALPDKYSLEAAFPNPFNPSTTIEYAIPTEANLDIRVYNMVGQLVDQQLVVNQKPGRYYFRWFGKGFNGQALPSGVYLVYFRAMGSGEGSGYSGPLDYSNTQKVILMK